MTTVTADAESFSNGAFRIGRTLNQTFRVFGRNALSFSVIAGLAYLPVAATDPATKDGWLVPALTLLLYYFLLQPISTAIILSAAFQDMRGRPVRLGESAQRGLTRLWPLISLAFLAVVGTLLGLVLLIVPGIIVYILWFIASPVCMVERMGPIQSLKRSRDLTEGHRWKIFGTSLSFLIVPFVIDLWIFSLWTMPTPLAEVAFYAVTRGVVQAVTSVFFVVLYHDLRVAKEGVDIDGIASVFD